MSSFILLAFRAMCSESKPQWRPLSSLRIYVKGKEDGSAINQRKDNYRL